MTTVTPTPRDDAPLVDGPVRVPRDLDGRIDVDRLVRTFAPVDLLESADGSGWTYLAPHLGPDLARLVDDGRRSWVVDADGQRRDLGTDPFDAIDRLAREHGIVPEASDSARAGLPGFTGGLIGALAPSLARRRDALPPPAIIDRDRPAALLRLVGAVLAIDPARATLLVIVRPALLAVPADEVRARIAALLEAATVAERTVRRPRPVPDVVVTSLPPTAHVAAIERVLAHIAAGDVYQVNVTQRLTGRWDGSIEDLHVRLRDASPASHTALLPLAGIVSVSPETFLSVRGRTVTTRPIKGTRRRALDPTLDAALADDLATSPKDRAENVMVVDLERNDLGRVCEVGSVVATEIARLEAFRTVWHLTSTVRGSLAEGVGYGALLAATFPSGSVTGAPKLAALRIIGAVEPVDRGFYCGAIGYLAPGAAELSVAIRTATLTGDGRVDYGTGGGIVADSDPHEEVAESLDKAVPFLRALEVTRVGAAARGTDARRAPAGGTRGPG